MNAIVSHYFRLRQAGMRPAQAWALAGDCAEIDANLAAAREALTSFLERALA